MARPRVSGLAERRRLLELVGAVQRALRTCDGDVFSAGWDFDYAASLPGSPIPAGALDRQLRRKVAEGRARYDTVRVQTLMGINCAPYARVIGYGDAVRPSGAPPLVALTLTAALLYRDGFDASGIQTFYFRRHGRDDFRIVGWQNQDEQEEVNHRRWLQTRR